MLGKIGYCEMLLKIQEGSGYNKKKPLFSHLYP